MAMYKSYAYDYVKYLQMLSVGELQKLFQNKLERDVLYNFWSHIQINHPTEAIKEEVVEKFKEEREELKLKNDFWTGIIL